MPKPDDVGVGTALLILNEKGQILLGKRKGAHRAGYWSFPGGWLDRSDTETKFAVIRETAEETGLIVHDAEQHLWVTEDHPEIGVRTVTLYHIARPGQWNGIPEVLEPDKCEKWGWYYPHSLPSPLFPGLRGAIDQIPVNPHKPLNQDQLVALTPYEAIAIILDRLADLHEALMGDTTAKILGTRRPKPPEGQPPHVTMVDWMPVLSDYQTFAQRANWAADRAEEAKRKTIQLIVEAQQCQYKAERKASTLKNTLTQAEDALQKALDAIREKEI